MYISDNIKYVGINDHTVDLFEGQYKVPDGMSYNSYVIIDEKTCVMDTVSEGFGMQWLKNINEALDGRKPDYLVVLHMEPDHSANIDLFCETYPDAQVISSNAAFVMMKGYFGKDYAERRIAIKEGDILSLGAGGLYFVAAPFVHWPEVMFAYETKSKTLFSADAFGKFGALDVEQDWLDEARRYYINIVGKFGDRVQAVLEKAAKLNIATICPLHGPVLKENLGYYINLYNKWSKYENEEPGTVIAYCSVYGNTREAALLLADKIKEHGGKTVVTYDLARCDMSQAVADAFRYNQLVVASTTYNGDMFPPMKIFLHELAERNYQDKFIGIIESGTWAPASGKKMADVLRGCKRILRCEKHATIRGAMNRQTVEVLDSMAKELALEIGATIPK